MAELYLFDGYNLLHAGPLAEPRELVDLLASFVALRGARGILVFDGVGEDAEHGALEVRYARHADTLLERLAASNRASHEVTLVTSDATLAAAAGALVAKRSTRVFWSEVPAAPQRDERPAGLAGRLDPAVAARLERLRRGR